MEEKRYPRLIELIATSGCFCQKIGCIIPGLRDFFFDHIYLGLRLIPDHEFLDDLAMRTGQRIIKGVLIATLAENEEETGRYHEYQSDRRGHGDIKYFFLEIHGIIKSHLRILRNHRGR